MTDEAGAGFLAAAVELARGAGLHCSFFAADGTRYPPAAAGERPVCGTSGDCPLLRPEAVCPAASQAPVGGGLVVGCRGVLGQASPEAPVRHLARVLAEGDQLATESESTVRELALTYQELAIAYGTLEALGGSTTREQMAGAVLDRAARAVGAQGGCFLSAGRDGEAALLASANLPEGELGVLRAMTLADLQRQMRQGLPFSFDLGQRHFLACPIQAQDRRLGLIAVFRPSCSPFTSREGKLLKATGRQAALAIRNRDLVDDLRDLFLSTVQALAAAVEAKDAYTSGHSRRVADMARDTAALLGLSKEEVEGIHVAAVVHDVGKIGVDTSILRKPGRLEAEEWAVLRAHPERGAGIIGCVPQLRHLVGEVRHHHERLDGGGYPEGLKGEEIPLGARIIAVSDAYDAMTSERPYRPAMSAAQARAELERCLGTQFDPVVAIAFLAAGGV